MDDNTTQQDYRDWQAERDYERHLLDAVEPRDYEPRSSL